METMALRKDAEGAELLKRVQGSGASQSVEQWRTGGQRFKPQTSVLCSPRLQEGRGFWVLLSRLTQWGGDAGLLADTASRGRLGPWDLLAEAAAGIARSSTK